MFWFWPILPNEKKYMTYHFVRVSNMHLVIVMHHEFRIQELFPEVEFGVRANLILGSKESNPI
jgi:hypothetical protein